jgi:hypothetical protein
MKNAAIPLLVMLSFLALLVSCRGAGVEPPVEKPVAWIVGDWVTEKPYAPDSDLSVFSADGTLYHWDNVDGSGLLGTFTWSLNGDVLTLNDGTQPQDLTITKMSNDEWSVSFGHFYRKAPNNNIFVQTETALSEGVSTPVTVAIDDMRLYSLTSSSASTYDVSWTNVSGNLTLDVYKSDKATCLLHVNTGGPNSSETGSIGAGEKIFIVVGGGSSGCTFDLLIGPVP